MTNKRRTIFISYRRTYSSKLARFIHDDLRRNGYDTFLDVIHLGGGEFEPALMTQIAAREFFVVVLAVGSTERFKYSDDIMRHEIEQAIKLKRRIIPVFQEDFTFEHAGNDMVGETAKLPKYNGISIRIDDTFDYSMERFRKKFIENYQDTVVLKSVTPEEAKIVEKQIELLNTEAETTLNQVRAEELVNHGRFRLQNDYTGRLEDFNQAIKLNPNFAQAYFFRGNVYRSQDKYDKAIKDYDRAISINPELSEAYNNRGYAYMSKYNMVTAIADFSEAINRDKHYLLAYSNRGYARLQTRDYPGAVEDFNEAIKLSPDSDRQKSEYYYYRGLAHFELQEYDKAITGFTQAIKLNPQYTLAYYNRGNAYKAKRQFEEAIKDYGQLLPPLEREFEHQYPAIHESLGDSYFELKQPYPALLAYQQFLYLNPNAKNKNQIRKRIEELKKDLGL
jgi:tetratricopeptide (TPR) repeat protein